MTSDVCDGCGKNLAAWNPDNFPEARSYREQRKGGGANHLVLREDTGNYKCAQCMGVAKACARSAYGRIESDLVVTMSDLCDECGEVHANGNRDPYLETVGYREQRKGGGANHIILRRDTGNWKCAECMDNALAKIPTNQMSLFGGDAA